jgi:hypothetical protein
VPIQRAFQAALLAGAEKELFEIGSSSIYQRAMQHGVKKRFHTQLQILDAA